MKLLKKYNPGYGKQKIVIPKEAGLNKSAFDLLKLEYGSSYSGNTENFESAFVILSGSCSITGENFNFEKIGSRRDPFSGKPTTVYLPCHSNYNVTALSEVEIGICSAESYLNSKPILIKPDDIIESNLGTSNWTRKAHFIITQDIESQNLFVGETLLNPGRWAFPPHRHDNDNFPEEIDMEEIYHFRFNPQSGFGIQLSYTDDRSRDDAYLVRNGDTVILPDGYHPIATSPVDSLYVLWFMAGEKRLFISRPEENYNWINKYENYLKLR